MPSNMAWPHANRLGPMFLIFASESLVHPLVQPSPADTNPLSYSCNGFPISIPCPIDGAPNLPKIYVQTWAASTMVITPATGYIGTQRSARDLFQVET